uniref:Uncharacterized protein n=1 Tax=Cacopsylla melanoneura TaxID=428564 RepID=A0A8D9BF34_9HEMI
MTRIVSLSYTENDYLYEKKNYFWILLKLTNNIKLKKSNILKTKLLIKNIAGCFPYNHFPGCNLNGGNSKMTAQKSAADSYKQSAVSYKISLPTFSPKTDFNYVKKKRSR